MTTQTITLPSSGRAIEVRFCDPADLLMDGIIPDVLTSYVEQLIYRRMVERGMATPEERAAMEAEQPDEATLTEQTGLFMRTLVCAGAVRPAVIGNVREAMARRRAGEDVLHIDQLSDQDIHAIYAAALGVAAALIPLFLQQMRADDAVAAVPDDAGDGPAGQQPAGGAGGAELGGADGGPGGQPVGELGGGQAVRPRRRRQGKVDAGNHPQS